ncbi:sigma-70 family RNA polymerase sigma factor [Viridibacillus sp. NPDC093762]|uniref:sigma-70 family RNA polymerase sigma factor n=1 Tax=Viridibacillus sp. NPDC093762 TaxID=3390720 RepID=UPI003D06E027
MNDKEKEKRLQQAMDDSGDYLVQLCYTYVRDWGAAEDAAQETFIRYYKNMEHFREDAALKTYLYRIAVNVSHDYIASWKYQKVRITDFFGKWIATKQTTESIVMERDTSKKLLHSIENLPTKYKDAIVLYHFAEMSLIEVSDTLNLNVNTVKTRLKRGRQLLGKTMQEGGELYGRSDS